MEQKEKVTIKGIKQEMSQIFNETGIVIPVTRILCETTFDSSVINQPCYVVGVSKGKGFTGVMKKWGFHGEMATRGQSNKPRQAGSIGGQTPGRVYKGKKMAGRQGNKQVTVKGLKIVKASPEKKELFVSGPVPGARNSKLIVKL